MEEIWKDIPGYEGYYQASNLGNIKSLPKFKKIFENKKYKTKTKILCVEKNSRGYNRVWLIKNGERKRFFVHRLIAETFIPNPENKPCVNHIDCNIENNKADNLEWCTQKENSEYAVSLGRTKWSEKQKENHRQKFKKFKKSIIGISLDGTKQIILSSLKEVKEFGYSPGDVCVCCKDNNKTYKGYKWRYYNG